ncbi:MAG: hypothetical protein D6695_08440 [Planctomycetota bacterium]|nr:MAG: hypothetical protein D6695_08440 [Planctomycetota bacterium]
MGLEFAIDELYATGWSALDTAGCEHLADGRSFPTAARVGAEFEAAGFDFSVRHIQLFDCYRAEWKERGGSMNGAVVGQSETEAAVYALSQLRRNMMAATS